jgi:Ni,Fe-hydrogenase I cytochrome b subunit
MSFKKILKENWIGGLIVALMFYYFLIPKDPSGVFYLDPIRQFIYWNKVAVVILGYIIGSFMQSKVR